MRIVVDQARCQGSARCYALVPEWFALDDETGLASAPIGSVPDEFLARVRAAVIGCPEQAISATEFGLRQGDEGLNSDQS